MNIGILGYGNLGRGVEAAIAQNADLELVAVFTRRDPSSFETLSGAPVYSTDELLGYKDKIDVLVLCGGSATDLPKDTPKYAEHFNVIDSFDTHAHIPEHFSKVDEAAKAGGKLALVSAGWDPGLFSINRVYAESILPEGKTYTFWGRGVSQGHSDAIRRIDGVVDARQYTNPVPSSLEKVRAGEMPELTTRDKHTRECYVVAEEGADLKRIESEIVNMPDYFSDYDTTVKFITAEEMKAGHAGLPHGGFVIRSGKTGLGRNNGEGTGCDAGEGTEQRNTEVIEYRLSLDSNPEFTGSVLAAYARALGRMYSHGARGAVTVLDFPPAYLSPLSGEELRKNLL